jgi:hypothetical protein
MRGHLVETSTIKRDADSISNPEAVPLLVTSADGQDQLFDPIASNTSRILAAPMKTKEPVAVYHHRRRRPANLPREADLTTFGAASGTTGSRIDPERFLQSKTSSVQSGFDCNRNFSDLLITEDETTNRSWNIDHNETTLLMEEFVSEGGGISKQLVHDMNNQNNSQQDVIGEANFSQSAGSDDATAVWNVDRHQPQQLIPSPADLHHEGPIPVPANAGLGPISDPGIYGHQPPPGYYFQQHQSTQQPVQQQAVPNSGGIHQIPPSIIGFLGPYGPGFWEPPPPTSVPHTSVPQSTPGGRFRDQSVIIPENRPPDMAGYAILACCVLLCCSPLFGLAALIIVCMNFCFILRFLRT